MGSGRVVGRLPDGRALVRRLTCDTPRPHRDLGVAVEALAADVEIGAALAQATERLKAGDEQAFEEQRRLHLAREQVKERLASLVASD